MDSGINIQPLINTLFQTVPIWAFIGIAVNYWMKKSREAVDLLHTRLTSIEHDVSQIKLAIATQGVANLAENIEELKEAKVEFKMKIDALFRIVDEWRDRNAHE